ncbi:MULTISPECIES: hypothetical protein [Inquilinus]|jgi:hypothetical protein|uniref:PepSY domain-containing protein n=1 Tax=Inquilinus ginsengisoli TaxID=363840 RepID=A0ABU1JPS6_9PROT|nr:hypothetical protein [Inquilinus ginsengisoli]MDR6290009.1 hypothetical protein [Inquilinus ginsengisoli]
MNFASVLSSRAAGPILGLALLAVPAAAQAPQQSPCAPYEIIAASLNERYHEAPVARMLADQGFVIEVLASADGATFTVLGVQPNGTACLLATGSGFAFVNAAATPAPGTGA